jgi:hypothetical protein
MSSTGQETRVTPIDVQVGGDADPAGIAQGVTAQDVNAILLADRPVAERLEELKTLRAEIATRANGDLGDDMDALLLEIDAAIEKISN